MVPGWMSDLNWVNGTLLRTALAKVHREHLNGKFEDFTMQGFSG